MADGKFLVGKPSGGVTTVTVADGATNTNLVLPESGTVATTNNITGFKNYIINGNFDVWQRGGSQTTTSYGSDDRWSNWNSVSTKTHSRISCTDIERALFNASYFSRTVASSIAGATNNVLKEQGIEDVTRLSGKTVTLSFWAKADSNKNISVEFSQQFGTGGTPSAQVVGIGAQLVSLTTVWQKKTITVTIPSIVGTTLGTDGVHTSSTWVRFWFDAGSIFNSRTANLGQQSGTFDIAQVQLEEGSVATPFENRPVGLELSLCKRYYEVCANQSVASTSHILANGCTNYTAPKRTTPSILVSGMYDNAPNVVSEYNTGSVFVASRTATASIKTAHFCFVQVSGTATTGYDIRYKLSIDAEL